MLRYFINLESTTVFADTSEIYHKKTRLISYIFLLDDSFSITADTSSRLNEFSYTDINTPAIVKMDRC